jgi:hypothetical protein
LTLDRGGRRIEPRFIRSYALCRTPTGSGSCTDRSRQKSHASVNRRKRTAVGQASPGSHLRRATHQRPVHLRRPEVELDHVHEAGCSARAQGSFQARSARTRWDLPPILWPDLGRVGVMPFGGLPPRRILIGALPPATIRIGRQLSGWSGRAAAPRGAPQASVWAVSSEWQTRSEVGD